MPENALNAAIQAVRALGLNFGAVDIGWNERDGPCVFEINTAPGIEESSLEAYTIALKTLPL